MPAITKLEAVNNILTAIGESRVSSLASGVVEAEEAEIILETTTREVLAKGWHWNRDEAYRLVPNGAGNIALPTTVLSIDPAGVDAGKDYVERDGRLYDRKNQTFTIDQPVYCDIIHYFDFETLPYALAKYIEARAARLFQESIEGSVALDSFTARREAEALANLNDAAFEVDDANVLLDSSSVRVIAYRHNRLWGQ